MTTVAATYKGSAKPRSMRVHRRLLAILLMATGFGTGGCNIDLSGIGNFFAGLGTEIHFLFDPCDCACRCSTLATGPDFETGDHLLCADDFPQPEDIELSCAELCDNVEFQSGQLCEPAPRL